MVKLVKKLHEMKEIQEELKKIGIESPNPVDMLIFIELSHLHSNMHWLLGGFGIGFGMVISLLTAILFILI